MGIDLESVGFGLALVLIIKSLGLGMVFGLCIGRYVLHWRFWFCLIWVMVLVGMAF